MHALWIPSWYAADPNDINGSFFREQAITLSRAGLQVGVIAPKYIPIYSASRPVRLTDIRTAQEGPLPVARLDLLQLVPKFRRVQTHRALGPLLRIYQGYTARWGIPDVLHAHSLYPGGFLADALSRRAGIPWVLTEHRSLSHMIQRTPAGRASERAVVARASARIGVSAEHAAAMAQRFGPRGGEWTTVPNLLPSIVLDGRREESPEPTIGHLSVLDPVKRPDLVIEGFARAFPGGGARLRIAGPLEGPSGTAVKRLVEASPVRERIDLLGQLRREEVADFMAGLDVFVLPSDSEPFGVVLIEALANGTPVVSTRTAGGLSIIEDGDGLLVERDPLDIARALDELTPTGRDAVARSARSRRCVERFGERAFVERYQNAYRQAVSG